MDDQAESEEASEESIGTDAGVVTVKCTFDWAKRTNFLTEIGSGWGDSHVDEK